jgi:hypothetical protein
MLLGRFANLKSRKERLADVPEEVKARTSSIKSSSDVEQQAVDSLFVRHRAKYVHEPGNDGTDARLEPDATGRPMRICASAAMDAIARFIREETGKSRTRQELKRILERKFGDDYKPKHYAMCSADEDGTTRRKRKASIMGWVWTREDEGGPGWTNVHLGCAETEELMDADMKDLLSKHMP